MMLVYQRVSEAQISINDELTRRMGRGAVWLFAVEKDDLEKDLEPFLTKCLKLRCFPNGDKGDRMDLSLLDIEGDILFVSQFTLCASHKKGNRPDFFAAEEPERAQALYQKGVDFLKRHAEINLITGEFGAHMDIELTNTGPVTFMLRRRNGAFIDFVS